MAINLKVDATGCSDCGGGGYFLGSSRTFYYYAKWFDNFQHSIPPLSFFCDSSNITQGSAGDWRERGAYLNGWYRANSTLPDYAKVNPRCMSSFATMNPFWLRTGQQGQAIAEKGDYIALEKYMGMVSELVSELSGRVVKWRDDGRYAGTLSPLFLSFWIGGCGAPCYPCSWEDVSCGWPYTMMYSIADNLDNYWDVYNDDHYPYFYTGFVVDYYGRITRGPEYNLGWGEWVRGMQADCDYCGCISFCILKDCIDGWYGSRMYTSKIMLFDLQAGIPYVVDTHLKKFGEDVQSNYDFGKLDIKLDHLADEGVFVGGYASYQYGHIEMSDINSLNNNQIRGIFSDRDVALYGNFISGISEFDYGNNNNRLRGIPEASITTGKGEKFKIESLRGADLEKGEVLMVPNLAVKYKNETTMPQISGFGWIYVDIPETVQKEYTSFKFTMDGGDVFPKEVTNECPAVGCDLPNLILNMKFERFYVRSTRSNFITGMTDAPILPYDEVPSVTFTTSNSIFALPQVEYNGPMHTQAYYKKYIKKIIKAPYNLYVKDEEKTFRTCKLGETLKDLEPGRYYFPNPIRCQNQFEFPDLESSAFESRIEVHEEDEFRKYFNINLDQFIGKDGKNTSLDEKYRNAVKRLGVPSKNATVMELSKTVPYTPIDLSNLSAEDVVGAINEMVKNGSLDQQTINLLKQAGIIK
jgi:hypothetical protein